MQGMLEAVRGCLKEELRMDYISNNLANATTAGFKKDRISFQNFLLQAGEGKKSAKGSPPNPDANLVRVVTDLGQGEIHSTGNDLDFAICGKGFFKINTPAGIRYTRKGNFALDRDGYLITQQGNRVMGKSGAINLLGDRIQVDDQGRILVDDAQVNQLDVVDLSDPESLTKEDALLFAASPDNAEVPIAAQTSIKQGYVEESNVNVSEEMVNMIHCMRAFESYQKAIQVLDKLDTKAANEVGRLR